VVDRSENFNDLTSGFLFPIVFCFGLVD